jgi:3',5'-cyclic AMP phosphodiesterase CpdA
MRTIAHLSDIHFGKVDSRIADALRQELLAAPPSLVVISGDLTQRARPAQFLAAREYLQALPRPQLVIPGNHDVPAVNLFNRFFRPLENYKKYVTADLRPIYRDDEILVMGLNTARSFTRQGGIIRPEQLLDIELRVRDTPSELFKIVVTHHPLMPAPGQVRTDLVKGHREALNTFEQVGVDMLLSGHFHLAYCGDVRAHHTAVKRSILSVHAGTAISTRIRRNEPQGYNRITVSPEHVTVEARSWNGGRFIAQTTTRYTRVDNEWWRDEALHTAS